MLNTHIWLWWARQELARLSTASVAALEDTAYALAVSAVSVYEVTFLAQRGRIVLPLPLNDWLRKATLESEIVVLPVTEETAKTAGDLPMHHGDPIDRIIIATVLLHDARLLSADSAFPLYRELDGRLVQ